MSRVWSDEVIAYAKASQREEKRTGELTDDDFERASLELALEAEVKEFLARRAANPLPESVCDEETIEIAF